MHDQLSELLSAGRETTTYVVAGHEGSGASAMMHALAHGGLEAACAPETEGRETGGYELDPEDQRHPWFPQPYWGKLIRVRCIQLVGLAPGDYRVVFMMRHPRELKTGKDAARELLGMRNAGEYAVLMKRLVAAASLRLDMRVLEMWHSEVVDGPLAAFEKIHRFGFPIDPAGAARAVAPALSPRRPTTPQNDNQRSQKEVR